MILYIIIFLTLITSNTQAQINTNNPDNKVLIAGAGGGGYATTLLFYFLKYIDTIKIDQTNTLLDNVSLISATSGSTVTASAYGLQGKEMFKNFESFLGTNVSREIFIHALIRIIPLLKVPFIPEQRSRLLAEYFNNLFEKQTLSNFKKEGPQIVINASSFQLLRTFHFTKEHLATIGQDFNSFSVGKAVAISSSNPPSAFGLTFPNQADPNNKQAKEYIKRYLSEENRIKYPDIWEGFLQLKTIFENPQDFPFLHLLDGAFSDILGLSYIFLELIPGGKLHNDIINKKLKSLTVFVIAPYSTQIETQYIKRSIIPRTSRYFLANNTFNSYTLYLENAVRNLLQTYELKYNIKCHYIKLNASLLSKEKRSQLLQINQVSGGRFAISKENREILRDSISLSLEKDPYFQDLLKDLKHDTSSTY